MTTAFEKTTRRRTIALIGNPNTGKSTLFNSLAGLRTRVGNFPGVTVEKKIGRVHWGDLEIAFVDLPGTYSLSPRTLDELVSVDVLLGNQADVGTVDAVICIVDAANLERNLYLFSQVLDLGLPTILVLNMWDVAGHRGVTIDVAALSERLGVPVVTTQAHRKRGLDDLRQAITAIADRAERPAVRVFPEAFSEEVESLRTEFEKLGSAAPALYVRERLLLDPGGALETRHTDRFPSLREWLAAARERLAAAGCRVPAIEPKVRYSWIRETLQDVVERAPQQSKTVSDRIDDFLTHRVAGLAVFCALMFVVFQAIYSWAGPFMDQIEALQSLVVGFVQSLIPPGALRSLIVDGVIAGVGGVLVFLPQIVILFLFIAVLEDCGYMARAAFLMDRLMTRIGLSGKSFVPLMSSFACAIPGIMATRVIENRRDRMVTILVAPLMSCSARLPVYLLLIGAFVPAVTYFGGWLTLQGIVLFAASALGALVAIPVAWVLKRTFFPGEPAPFVMELPSYKLPSPRIVFHRVYDRAKAFVIRAGTLIFATTVLVWAAGYFPADHSELHAVVSRMETLEAQPDSGENAREIERLATVRNRLSGQLIQQSVLGRLGQFMEPIVKPLGWDWKIGVGVLASFPAREVVIATLGTIYSLGGDVDEADEGLMGAMRDETWPDGSPIYTVPVAFSIMVFFALCAQCAATLMVIRRETNSWRWPLLTFGYMTVLAYVGAWLAYVIGSAIPG